MDHMSNFRPDSSHVAQQSRRDKLRVQQANFQLQDEYANNVQHFPLHHTQNLDLMHVRNVNYRNNTNNPIYDQTVTISEMPNYSSTNSNVDFDRPKEAADAHFTRNVPQCGIWRSISSAQHQHHDTNKHSSEGNLSSSLANHRHESSEIFSDQENYTHFTSPSQMYHTNASNSWMNTHAESSSHHTQGGLSLSLSSKSSSLETRVVPHVPQDSNLRQSTARGHGNLLQDIVGISTYDHRHTGPLGPFTGYATILKSSKFLRPAQLLLDEICRPGHVSSIATDGNLGLCSSTFHGSNEGSGDFGVGSNSCEPHLPEYQHKKAKLLCMHEEVCRKYKQYNQQMQMVVSSFETVAGLSASTPYISLAVKTVAKHFRHLKNTITDQLGSLKKSLAEDFSSPNTSTRSKLNFVEQGCQKYNNNSYGERSEMGFLDNQQQVWRPQRGLPERAVSVLRAWLFEHFLHPYPTDTDKHVLANQTGLTRNQVSNWFINARVRVWKPMVEEIHMLETKSLAEADPNEDTTPSVGTNSKNTDQQPLAKLNRNNASGDVRMEGNHGKAMDVEEWNQEKRSRVEGHHHHHHHIQPGMGGPMMGYVPYHQNGLEIGGLGSISLTLGLRQSAESAQQQQQLRQHFGGHILHDFVG